MAKVYQENELMGIKNELEKPADWHWIEMWREPL